jgi:hypothetical protein
MARGFIAGFVDSAFGKKSASYSSTVVKGLETTYTAPIADTSDDLRFFPQPLTVNAMLYILDVPQGREKTAVVEVSGIYRDKIAAGGHADLVEKARRFFWVPFRSYELVLSDGTKISLSDDAVTWLYPGETESPSRALSASSARV